MKRNQILLPFVFILILLLAGCPGRLKKPSPAPTPKPAKLSLEEVAPAKAPAAVRDLIEKQKERETFNVVREGTSLYAVVTRGKVPFKGMGVKFKDVERIDIGNGRNQVRIQITFSAPEVVKNPANTTGQTEKPGRLTPEQRAALRKKLGPRGEFYPAAVAKLNIDTLPDVFSYNVLRERENRNLIDEIERVSPQATVPEISTTPVPAAKPSISVTTPPPNASVTTPLTVSGTAGSALVTIELKDIRGNLIAAKTVGVVKTPGQATEGDFNTTLAFTPLKSPVQGSLTVFSPGPGGGREAVVTIPLTIR